LQGKAYVYAGGAKGLSKNPVWTATGESLGSQFGYSLASGDFNGDGISDLLVGAPGFDRSRGRVYLYLGKGGPGLEGSARRIYSGEKQGDYFGQGLANAGDVNGDGIDDFAVGAPSHEGKGLRSGKAYFFLGEKGL
jgi:hypothetical protein